MIAFQDVKVGDIVWIFEKAPRPMFVMSKEINEEVNKVFLGLNKDGANVFTHQSFNGMFPYIYSSYPELMNDVWNPNVYVDSDDALFQAADRARNEGMPAQQPDSDLEMLLGMLCHPRNERYFQGDQDILRLAHGAMERFRKKYPDHLEFFDECNPIKREPPKKSFAEAAAGASASIAKFAETMKNSLTPVETHEKFCEIADTVVPNHRSNPCAEVAMSESLADKIMYETNKAVWDSILRDPNPCKEIPAERLIQEVKPKDVESDHIEFKPWFKIEDEQIEQLHESFKKSSLFQNMADVRPTGEPIRLDAGIEFKDGVLRLKDRAALEECGDDEYEEGSLKTTPEELETESRWWSFENDEARLHAEYDRDQESLFAGHVHEDFWTCYCLGEEYNVDCLIWYKRHAVNEPEMCPSCKCCLQTHEDGEKTVVKVGDIEISDEAIADMRKAAEGDSFTLITIDEEKEIEDFPPRENFLTKDEALKMWREAGHKPELETESRCDCGNPSNHLPNGINCWKKP